MTRIHTACKDCVFSKYDKDTQIGCSLNKIEAFENIGVEIVPVYDDEKNFYVISDRRCQFYRNGDWLLKNDVLNPKTAPVSEIIQKEVQIGVTILLLVREGQTFDEIKISLSSIEKSTIKPESIVILLQNTYFGQYPINHQWIKSNITIPYSVEYIVPKTSVEKCINIGARRSSIYYVVVECGKELKENYIENINTFINTNMFPLLMYENDLTYHQVFVNKAFHDYAGGFGKKTIHEKALSIMSECDPYTFVLFCDKDITYIKSDGIYE